MKNKLMTFEEQRYEEEMMVADRRNKKCRRKSDIDYLLLNYDMLDRRKEDRRAE
jgi:hypothetical protein